MVCVSGRTLACIAATGQEKIQKGFGPMVGGFSHGHFNDLESMRCFPPRPGSTPLCRSGFSSNVHARVHGWQMCCYMLSSPCTHSAMVNDNTAAVLVEGVQGEGGIVPIDARYLLGLRKLCDEHNALLFIDAVQCGHFRTGRFQSYQRILDEFVPANAEEVRLSLSLSLSLSRSLCARVCLPSSFSLLADLLP